MMKKSEVDHEIAALGNPHLSIPRLKLKELSDSMDYIQKLLEKVKDWARKVIETLLGPEAEPAPEPIPVPVRDSNRRR